MPITKLSSSRDFFRIWFLRKFQALLSFVVIVGFVMFYAYGATPMYESKAKVLVLPRATEELVITAGVGDRRQPIQAVTTADLHTEAELIMSDNVVYATVAKIGQQGLGLKSEERGAFNALVGSVSGLFKGIFSLLGLTEEPLAPVERDAALLRGALMIEPAFDSNVLLVSLKGQNGERTAAVLRTLLEVYVTRHNEAFSMDAGFDFYDDQAGTYLKRLEDAERKLQEFNLEYNVVDLENQNTANIGLMTELNKELQLIEIDYDEAERRIEILQTALEKAETEDALVTAEMRVIPAIVELEKAIIPLVIRRTEVSKRFTLSSREVQQLDLQLKELKAALTNEVRKALETDRLELSTLATKKNSLGRKIGELRAQATQFNQARLEMVDLQRQVDIHKNHYLLYTSKTENSRIYGEKKSRNLANVSVVDLPKVPSRPFSPNRILLLVAGVLLGSMSAISLPFILEAWDQKLKTVDDVESLLSVQVVSSFSEAGK